MDGMHCFIDSTSILVKIKSVSLHNCRTVYMPSFYSFMSPIFTFFVTGRTRILQPSRKHPNLVYIYSDVYKNIIVFFFDHQVSFVEFLAMYKYCSTLLERDLNAYREYFNNTRELYIL